MMMRESITSRVQRLVKIALKIVEKILSLQHVQTRFRPPYDASAVIKIRYLPFTPPLGYTGVRTIEILNTPTEAP
jgi:hypothetical protein